MSSGGFRGFLASALGRIVMSLAFAVIIWGVEVLLLTKATTVGMVLAGICAIMGWRVLNSITPSMFVWMSWIGWIIYFVLKLTIAYFIGIIVLPFKLGTWIADKVGESL